MIKNNYSGFKKIAHPGTLTFVQFYFLRKFLFILYQNDFSTKLLN